MSSVAVRMRLYRRRHCAGLISLPIAVHETRIKHLARAGLLPEQEDHERSDTVAAQERMLERLCEREVP